MSDVGRERDRLSVYAVPSRASQQNHPLADLLPEDLENGWHVARNLLKPLNHLDFLRRKEEIAELLNLHSVRTPDPLFAPNYDLLLSHQARSVATPAVIHQLADRIDMSEARISQLLREYATIRHMEFHPTDFCNLACKGCTYGHDLPSTKPPPIHYPFAMVNRISGLRPRSVVLIGGGEPTLYRSGGARFDELVTEVIRCNSNVTLGLVTNGTYRPTGPWPQGLAWIRLSLDAATRETYKSFRGAAMFERVVDHFLDYLDSPVRYVGVSFLFARSNVHEYADVARLIFEVVKRNRPAALEKVNIQYRPLRRDPYRYDEPFTEAVSDDQIERVVSDVRMLADSSVEMRQFLKNQTNVCAILGGSAHPSYSFDRCYYSQTFHIVRANGDIRPCFIRVEEPDFILGNILHDSLETIALNTLLIGAARKPHCDAHGCRQCHVNFTFQQGLEGRMQPSNSIAVRSDPMY